MEEGRDEIHNQVSGEEKLGGYGESAGDWVRCQDDVTQREAVRGICNDSSNTSKVSRNEQTKHTTEAVGLHNMHSHEDGGDALTERTSETSNDSDQNKTVLVIENEKTSKTEILKTVVDDEINRDAIVVVDSNDKSSTELSEHRLAIDNLPLGQDSQSITQDNNDKIETEAENLTNEPNSHNVAPQRLRESPDNDTIVTDVLCYNHHPQTGDADTDSNGNFVSCDAGEMLIVMAESSTSSPSEGSTGEIIDSAGVENEASCDQSDAAKIDVEKGSADKPGLQRTWSWLKFSHVTTFSTPPSSPKKLQRETNYFFQDSPDGRERVFSSVSSLLSIVLYTLLFGVIACQQSESCNNSKLFFIIPIVFIYMLYLTESLMDKTTRNYLRNHMSLKEFEKRVDKWRHLAPRAMITVRLLPGWQIQGKGCEELKKDRKISATLIYKKCVDYSDDTFNMASHLRFKVIVYRTFSCEDILTSKNLEREIKTFKKYCGFAEKGMECVRELELDGYQKRFMVYQKKPWYLNMQLYWLCLILGLCGPYRVWTYFRFSETFNYKIIKSFSVRR